MRRKKANENDLLVVMGIGLVAVRRCMRTDKAGKVIRGTRYILGKPMTKQQEEYIKQFKNVVISTAQYRWAPEIKHQTIILTDVCLS